MELSDIEAAEERQLASDGAVGAVYSHDIDNALKSTRHLGFPVRINFSQLQGEPTVPGQVLLATIRTEVVIPEEHMNIAPRGWSQAIECEHR